MERQLYKSRENRMISGVCGGMAEYFNIDVTLVRLIWVIVGFTYGMGIIAYIIAAIVIPERSGNYQPGPSNSGDQAGHEDHGFNIKPVDYRNTRTFLGSALVILGLLFLAKQFIGWFDSRLFWPIILIAIGVFVIFAGRRNR